ncbi:MAG: diacylglycerol kinase family protein [Bacteroidia bacterium]|nr:hypothetical protein [Bacteroidia bacterium]MDW8159221.1 diacylglycerol kinase family protein [Bacteroidia bacterium]
MKFLIILNIKLGKQKGEKIKKRIQQHLEKKHIKAEIWFWEYPTQIDWLLEKAKNQNFDVIIAGGGDGTVHHIGTRLIGTSIILGILPLGSGNGIANHFGIPPSISQAIDVFNHHEVISIDTGLVNGKPFIGFFSIGLDACVIHTLANQKRGFWQYLKTAISIYFGYQPEWVKWENGKEKSSSELLVLAVVNTSQYGNGVKIAPEAVAQDEKFNLVTLSPIQFWQIPSLILRAFNGTITQFKGYNHYVIQKSLNIYRLNTPDFQKGKAQADGEAIFLPSEIKVEIIPSSLKLLVPANLNKILTH